MNTQSRERILRSFCRSWVLAAVIFSIGLHRAAADVIANWTFESTFSSLSLTGTTVSNIPADSGANTAGSAASGLHASASTVFTGANVGNGSAHSFSSNTWAVGDYYQFSLSTVGYKDLTVTFDQISSSTGPGQFQFSYSTDGTNFTNVGSPYTVLVNASPNAWSGTTPITASTFTFDLASVASLNNASTAIFRLTDFSTTSAGGATVATGGTDRVDNFIVAGRIPPAPGTFLNWGSSGTGGNGTWSTSGTNWYDPAIPADVPFNSSKLALFSGTGGTVTVVNITANAGVEFDVTGYTLTGGTLTLTGTTTVLGGVTTIIDTVIDGLNGLIKAGSGILVLGGSNTFSGGVALNGGTLRIGNDSNLGAAGNSLALANTRLETTASISMTRSITGSGTFDIAPGTILQNNGGFVVTALTLSNTGTLDLVDPSVSVGALTFTAPGTLTSSVYQVAATSVNASSLTGTATISPVGGLVFNALATVNVGSAGTVLVPSPVFAFGLLTKSGNGTLVLNGTNTSLSQLRITAGTVSFNNNQALGGGPGFPLNLNSGTLNPTTDLTGANALSVGVSFGAASSAPSLITGSNLEFTGASNIFQTGTGQSGVTVNNTTTLSGAFSVTGSSSGLVVGGTGRMIFNGNGSAMTVLTTATDSATLVINDVWAGNLRTSSTNAVLQVGGSLSGTTSILAGTLRGTGTMAAVVVGNSAGTKDSTVTTGTSNAISRLLTATSLTLNSDAVFALKINTTATTPATNTDLLTVTGTLSLAGSPTLSLTDLNPNATPLALGTEFVFLKYGGYDGGLFRDANGTLLNNGDAFFFGANQFQILYNGNGIDPNEVLLRAVPEPSTSAMIAGGTALLGWFAASSRRKRQAQR